MSAVITITGVKFIFVIYGVFLPDITDACLYFKADSDRMRVVGVYVDDLLVTGTNDSRVSLLTWLCWSSWTSALPAILWEFACSTMSSMATSLTKKLLLWRCLSSSSWTTRIHFQSLLGSLLWIAKCTRPDIMFAVHCATRRTHAPTMADWKIAKRFSRYLSDTRLHKLCKSGDGKAQNLPLRLRS
ncbi:hypothetical protein Plhal304r1_c019g0068941 [Plasmopara halstedii]